MNSLTDTRMIDLLYEASAAGVSIDLIVRGICCLRPGVVGLSENIRVRSIVGRFLEHSRILYFENFGEPEALIGSADLMQRNLDRRVEVLVPIQSPYWIAYLRDVVLAAYLRDNQQAWELTPDDGYKRIKPTLNQSDQASPTRSNENLSKNSEEPFSAQNYLMKHSALRAFQEDRF